MLLPACSSLGPFGAPGPVHSAFSRTLDSEYTALADYEDHTVLNHGAALSFRQKAAMARQGLMPQPGEPDAKTLPPDAQSILSDARSRLVQSIQRGDWIDNGPTEALAQTRFDCWLAAEPPAVAAPGGTPGPDAGEACHQVFETAMAQMAPPTPQAADYTVYFDPNSIAIHPDGMAAVQQAARLVRGQQGWAGVLTGHTAFDETGVYAANLAVRRAMSVRNALAQEGVSLDALRIGDPAQDSPGLPPAQQRRVDIQILPADQAVGTTVPVAPGLPTATFGSLKPVF